VTALARHRSNYTVNYRPVLTSERALKFQGVRKFGIIKSRRMRLASHVAGMEERRNAYRLLVGKPEGKRPLGRPRRRWVDNIRMDLGEVGRGDVDWIGLAQDRNRWRALVNSVLKLSGSMKFWETIEWPNI
jgi:hypothetical protein